MFNRGNKTPDPTVVVSPMRPLQEAFCIKGQEVYPPQLLAHFQDNGGPDLSKKDTVESGCDRAPLSGVFSVDLVAGERADKVYALDKLNTPATRYRIRRELGPDLNPKILADSLGEYVEEPRRWGGVKKYYLNQPVVTDKAPFSERARQTWLSVADHFKAELDPEKSVKDCNDLELACLRTPPMLCILDPKEFNQLASLTGVEGKEGMTDRVLKQKMRIFLNLPEAEQRNQKIKAEQVLSHIRTDETLSTTRAIGYVTSITTESK